MSWFSKLLGFDLAIEKLNDQIDNYVFKSDDEIQFLRSQLENKDAEILRLTNLIFVEHGVIVSSPIPSNVTSEPHAINSRFSWTQKQRNLEKKDRELAQKLTSEKEDYWTKKNKETAEAEALIASELERKSS